jgi:hypothetical protein
MEDFGSLADFLCDGGESTEIFSSAKAAIDAWEMFASNEAKHHDFGGPLHRPLSRPHIGVARSLLPHLIMEWREASLEWREASYLI